MRQAPLLVPVVTRVQVEIPEWAKRVPSTSLASHRGARASNVKKGKFLTGQARNYCDGEGYSCLLHEACLLENIMFWRVAKVRFNVLFFKEEYHV